MVTARVAEVLSYRLIEELLSTQGWDLRRPPQGDVLAQHEYKDYPSLRDALKVSGKKGVGGPGIPEYVLMERETEQPLAVFEAKAYVADLSTAVSDVETYGNAFGDAGFSVLAVAVAGTRDDRFGIRVKKWNGIRWVDITYESKPISWIPNQTELGRILTSPTTFELRPTVPSPEVLKEKAEEINGLLRESGLKDDYRPATIGAMANRLDQQATVIGLVCGTDAKSSVHGFSSYNRETALKIMGDKFGDVQIKELIIQTNAVMAALRNEMGIPPG
jgi:type I restriction enzyme M protein